MGKFFTFADRACRIQFFEEEPVVVTMFVGDETDKLTLQSAALIDESDKLKSVDERTKKYREAVELLMGKEKTAAVLDRAETNDSFTLLEVWQYVVKCLRDHKVKNLSASVR